mgnify:CR=1 FL=1
MKNCLKLLFVAFGVSSFLFITSFTFAACGMDSENDISNLQATVEAISMMDGQNNLQQVSEPLPTYTPLPTLEPLPTYLPLPK